jgi:hypothetical protein
MNEPIKTNKATSDFYNNQAIKVHRTRSDTNNKFEVWFLFTEQGVYQLLLINAGKWPPRLSTSRRGVGGLSVAAR